MHLYCSNNNRPIKIDTNAGHLSNEREDIEKVFNFFFESTL